MIGWQLKDRFGNVINVVNVISMWLYSSLRMKVVGHPFYFNIVYFVFNNHRYVI